MDKNIWFRVSPWRLFGIGYHSSSHTIQNIPKRIKRIQNDDHTHPFAVFLLLRLLTFFDQRWPEPEASVLAHLFFARPSSIFLGSWACRHVERVLSSANHWPCQFSWEPLFSLRLKKSKNISCCDLYQVCAYVAKIFSLLY